MMGRLPKISDNGAQKSGLHGNPAEISTGCNFCHATDDASRLLC